MAGEGQGQHWAGVLPGSSSHGGHWELSQDSASGSQQVWALVQLCGWFGLSVLAGFRFFKCISALW